MIERMITFTGFQNSIFPKYYFKRKILWYSIDSKFGFLGNEWGIFPYKENIILAFTITELLPL